MILFEIVFKVYVLSMGIVSGLLLWWIWDKILFWVSVNGFFWGSVGGCLVIVFLGDNVEGVLEVIFFFSFDMVGFEVVYRGVDLL